MARGSGRNALVALGYAGWSAGQLENEIAQNAWLTAPCDERILFDTPYEQRWRAAGRLLGIDLHTSAPTRDMPDGGRARTCPAPQLILAFDFGTRRIGVAVGDTLRARRRGLSDAAILRAAARRGPRSTRSSPTCAVAAGRRPPLNMDGTPTALTAAARAFAAELGTRYPQPVALVDERLSSREAEAELRDARAAGLKRRRATHGDVDMTAAQDSAGTLVRGTRLPPKLSTMRDHDS